MKTPDLTRAQLAAVTSAVVAVLAAFHWDASGGTTRSVVYSAAALAAVWIGGDAHIRGRRAVAASIQGGIGGRRHAHLADTDDLAGGAAVTDPGAAGEASSGATSATSSGGPAKTA